MCPISPTIPWSRLCWILCSWSFGCWWILLMAARSVLPPPAWSSGSATLSIAAVSYWNQISMSLNHLYRFMIYLCECIYNYYYLVTVLNLSVMNNSSILQDLSKRLSLENVNVSFLCCGYVFLFCLLVCFKCLFIKVVLTVYDIKTHHHHSTCSYLKSNH